MGTVRYTVADGEILAENRNGTKRDYLPDPLGSTVALLDSSQAQTDTYTYWPYGEQASSTGSTDTPFRYVGTLGYHRDKASINVKTYVRARYLDHAKCRWMTQDPIGFDGGDYNLYRYVRNRSVIFTDPSGMWNPACVGAIICAGGVIISALIGCRNDPKGIVNCVACWCQKNPTICASIVLACGAMVVGCIGVPLPSPSPVPVPVMAGTVGQESPSECDDDDDDDEKCDPDPGMEKWLMCEGICNPLCYGARNLYKCKHICMDDCMNDRLPPRAPRY